MSRTVLTDDVRRGWIQGIAARLNSKPLLNIVGGIIEDYDYLWDEYYFSTSTM